MKNRSDSNVEITPPRKINHEAFKKLSFSPHSQLQTITESQSKKTEINTKQTTQSLIKVKDFAKITRFPEEVFITNKEVSQDSNNNNTNQFYNLLVQQNEFNEQLNTNIEIVNNYTDNHRLIVDDTEKEDCCTSKNKSSNANNNIEDIFIISSDDDYDDNNNENNNHMSYKTPTNNNAPVKRKLTRVLSSHTNEMKNGKQKLNSTTTKPIVNKIKRKKNMKSQQQIDVENISIQRKLTKNTNLKWITNKYLSEDQTKITNFFPKIKNDNRTAVGYFETFVKSDAPVIITGDLPLQNYLDVIIIESDSDKEEEDAAAAPTANNANETNQIEQQQRQQKKPEQPKTIDNNMVNESVDENVHPKQPKNTEILSKFMVSIPLSKNDNRIKTRIVTPIKSNDDTTQNNVSTNDRRRSKRNISMSSGIQSKLSAASSSSSSKPKRKITCPDYKIIAGTNFAVDAFRYGYIMGIEHYFLTHFHSDHYIGLKKSFSKPLYVSTITANLIELQFKIDKKYINIINKDETITIDGIEITALDANHCPGSLMFVFKLLDSFGTTILHTGDFRASPDMESYSIFWNNDIQTIYLDTTYLSSMYDLKSQNESIDYVIDECRIFNIKNIGEKILYICGTYLIGKEKVWSHMAQVFNLKVWCSDDKRRKAITCIADETLLKYMVEKPEDANLHLISLDKVNYQYLAEYLKNYQDSFTKILAFRPSGWEKNSRPSYGNKITMIGVEYSEHSSYHELERFVRFLQPKEVISTVPANGNMHITPQIPMDWLNGEVKPRRKGYQQSITNFFLFNK